MTMPEVNDCYAGYGIHHMRAQTCIMVAVVDRRHQVRALESTTRDTFRALNPSATVILGSLDVERVGAVIIRPVP